MDNQRSTEKKQNPASRPRQDSVTPEMRRHMQQGYPVRSDATQTINRPINRPAGPREVPQHMRQGKIPVRQDAVKGRTYPVMNRNGQPQTRPVPPETMTTTIPRVPEREQVSVADMEATREFPVIPPTGENRQSSSPVLPHEVTPQEPIQKRKTALSGKRYPTLIAGVAALVLVIVVGLGVGAALRSTPGTEPDFDMSAHYNAAGENTDTADVGVGREDVTDTETETLPPETTPPPVKFSVTLTFFDREPITISTSETTLGTLLTQVGYEIQNTDAFPLDLDTVLTEDTTIAVDTVEILTDTKTETIPYETKVTNVRTIPKGQKNVMQKGQNGTKTITYEVKTVNGEEVSRTVIKEEVTTAPVTETAQLGIGGTINGHSYSYYRTVNATYYDIEGLTYLGYNADETVVAVDMDYIPLGTKIYVANDKFDFGVRTAADTGSMIEGWEVDIWLSDSNPQKAAFAQIGYVTDMIIYYLD